MPKLWLTACMAFGLCLASTLAVAQAAAAATPAAPPSRPWYIPDTQDPRLTTATIRYVKGETAEALRELDALRTAQPPLQAADAMRLDYVLAMALFEQARIDNAVSMVRRALQPALRNADADLPLIQLLAAQLAMRRGQWREAFIEANAAFAGAAKVDPSFNPLLAATLVARLASAAPAGMAVPGADEALDWLRNGLIESKSETTRAALQSEPWTSLAVLVAVLDGQRSLQRGQAAAALRTYRMAADIERRSMQQTPAAYAETLRRLRLTLPLHGPDQMPGAAAMAALLADDAPAAQAALTESLSLGLRLGGLERANQNLLVAIGPALAQRRCALPDLAGALQAPALPAAESRALHSLLLNQIGLCWLGAGGRPAQGEATLLTALELEQGVQPANPAELATRHQNLALARTMLGRHELALSDYRRAIELRRGTREGLHAQSLLGLAATQVVSGAARRDEAARKEAVEALLAVLEDTAFRRNHKAEFEGSFCALVRANDIAIEPMRAAASTLRERAAPLCPAVAAPAPAPAASGPATR